MRIVLFCLILTSCYTAKKADKQLGKALDNYPDKVAEIARGAFPCTDIDSVVTYRDSLVYVECPDYTFSGTDTVYRDKIIPGEVRYVKGADRVVRVPVNLPVRTVTVRVEDSAKIYLAIREREAAVKERDEWKGKAKTRGKWNLWLVIVCAVLALLNYIQFRR